MVQVEEIVTVSEKWLLDAVNKWLEKNVLLYEKIINIQFIENKSKAYIIYETKGY